ncbi:MAG: carotenoid 1,2-hydratase, partial [Verrucomicrobiaceae bacterium]|nr:carotenoid 1,2-hydratase [Verrucomicrobiaceae bacterium]
SLQLNDGRCIMVYRMRLRDGGNDPAGTTLAMVEKDGSVKHTDAAGFTWKPGRTWTSAVSCAVYTIEAEISTQDDVFMLAPLNEAQEVGGAISGLPYWEGACDVLDGNGKVIGRAFLELAGYAGDLARHLGGAGVK